MTTTQPTTDINQCTPHDVDASHLILDVRSRDEFAREHIPGSLNIPLDELLSRKDELLENHGRIVVSCRSGNRAKSAYQTLEQQGFDNLALLEGGLQNWKRANQPTNSFKSGISIMRQVQIIVGVMVLSGVFIPALWFLALIAGAGMLIAGLTDTCMMAVMLQKMPWNNTKTDTGKTCSL